MKARDVMGALVPHPAAPPVVSKARALPLLPVGRLVRSGMVAGATLVAVSAASAATSAVRRRVEGS